MACKKMEYLTLNIPKWGGCNVWAWVYGDFAVHWTLYVSGGTSSMWTVTHIPTGYALYTEFSSSFGAVELAERAAALELPVIHTNKRGMIIKDANWRKAAKLLRPLIQEAIMVDSGEV